MRDLTTVEQTALDEVVFGPGGSRSQPGPCWSPRRRIVLVSSESVVSGLVASGWLDEWPEVQGVTLTPWSAVRLGVRLECREDCEDGVWVPATDPETQPRIPRWIASLPSLAHLPDPRRDQTQNENTPRLAGGVGSVRDFLERRKRVRPLR